VDFEQERRPSVHPATDLKRYNRTVSDNAIDDKLVGVDRSMNNFNATSEKIDKQLRVFA
jgi:hypothetical protein